MKRLTVIPEVGDFETDDQVGVRISACACSLDEVMGVGEVHPVGLVHHRA